MRFRSFALPAVATALALAGLSAPAHAEPADTDLMVGVLVPEQVTVIAGQSKTIRAQVVNAGPVEAKDVVLKLSGVDPSLGLTLPAGCDQNGCAVGDLAPGARRVVSLRVTPTGTDLTSTFELAVGAFETEVTVVRAAGGVDLEVDPIDDLKLGRGESADLPVTVRNTGSSDVAALALVVVTESGIEALTKYRNCQSETEDPEFTGVICLFEQSFPAGSTFTLPEATPLQVRVAADAGGPYTYGGAVIAVGVNDETALDLSGESGPTLRMQSKRVAEPVEEEPEDINPEDNIAVFGVAVPKSSADSAAVGATFTGAVGATATAKVGVRNLGPTGVIPGHLEWFPAVEVTVPAGIKLTKVDEDCVGISDGPDSDFPDYGEVAGLEYVCIPLGPLGNGAEELFSFTGVITDGSLPAGSVVVDGGIQDTAAGNDKAVLGVKVTGAGTGGGDGTGGDNGTGNGGVGGGEGGLPITGTPVGLVALGGALLLLGGGAALVLARRRRIVTTVGD